MSPRDSTIDCGCKVGRLARQHDLSGCNAELKRRWLGEGPEERQSVRDLATYFNREVFGAIIEESGADVMTAQVAYLYDVLNDDEADEDERAEVRNRLERYEIDVDSLDSEFVSYQSIHNHLTGCLDLSSPVEERTERNPEADKDTLRRLQVRTENVAGDILERHLDDEHVDPESLEVDATVTVRCNECGYKRSVSRLLSDGACYCEREAEPSGSKPDESGGESTETEADREPATRVAPSGDRSRVRENDVENANSDS